MSSSEDTSSLPEDEPEEKAFWGGGWPTEINLFSLGIDLAPISALLLKSFFSFSNWCFQLAFWLAEICSSGISQIFSEQADMKTQKLLGSRLKFYQRATSGRYQFENRPKASISP